MVASAIPPSFHQHSVSLGSRSGSVPHSLSVASESRGQSLASSVSTSDVTGPSKPPMAVGVCLIYWTNPPMPIA